jgi:hypothetical protein
MKILNETTTLTDRLLNEILFCKDFPCVSLYQPTKRMHPGKEQNQKEFMRLLGGLQVSLLKECKVEEVKLILEPLHSISRDVDFWKSMLDGLVILSGPNYLKIFKLPQSFVELTLIAENFHSAPLRHYLQSIDRYQVLSIGLDRMRFFEGNSHSVEEVVLTQDLPRTIVEALGPELTKPHENQASFGFVGSMRKAMNHGYDGTRDEASNDTDRFFRLVDKAVLEKYSEPSRLPLILVALPEHQNLFHKISKNPFLIEKGIHINSEAKSFEELHELTWKLIEPLYLHKLDEVSEFYNFSKSKNLGSEDLVEIAKEAAEGRVETLIVGGDLELYGHIDSSNGKIDYGDASNLHGEDILNELEEIVVKKGGLLQVIRSGKMPMDKGLAAIFRY